MDIETLPPDRGSSAIGVREEIVSCSEEEFRRLALDGDFGRILTIGVIIEQNDQVNHHGLFGRERQTIMFHVDEARTLRGFWKLVKGFNVSRDLLIGHNVFDFDLPFLYKRSVIQCVRPTVDLPFTRYRSRPVFASSSYEERVQRWKPARRRRRSPTASRSTFTFVEKLWRRWRETGSCAALPHAGGRQRALREHSFAHLFR